MSLSLVMLGVLILGVTLHLVVVSQVIHARSQQLLYADLRGVMARQEAPTGQVDFNGQAHPFGTPVAIVEIPTLNLREVVVEGTTASAMEKGVGHLRSSVLPGQAGISVIFGRRSTYGSPFAEVAQLAIGTKITTFTGQGQFEYVVTGIRHEGSVIPPPPPTEGGRLTLVTLDGPFLLATEPVFVDANLVTPAATTPGRSFGSGSLLPQEQLGARDYTQFPVILLWASAVTAILLGGTWAAYRWGRVQAWIVGAPGLVLALIGLGTSMGRLLPNLT